MADSCCSCLALEIETGMQCDVKRTYKKMIYIFIWGMIEYDNIVLNKYTEELWTAKSSNELLLCLVSGFQEQFLRYLFDLLFLVPLTCRSILTVSPLESWISGG